MNEPKPKSRPKTPRPVESFGPEILAALVKAAIEPVVLHLSYRTATRLRMRIHQLREAMRKSGHEKYSTCARVVITVRWPQNTPLEKAGRYNIPIDRGTICEVKLQANDLEFADQLRQAGVSIELGSDLALQKPLEPVEGQPLGTETLEEILKNFGEN